LSITINNPAAAVFFLLLISQTQCQHCIMTWFKVSLVPRSSHPSVCHLQY